MLIFVLVVAVIFFVAGFLPDQQKLARRMESLGFGILALALVVAMLKAYALLDGSEAEWYDFPCRASIFAEALVPVGVGFLPLLSLGMGQLAGRRRRVR